MAFEIHFVPSKNRKITENLKSQPNFQNSKKKAQQKEGLKATLFSKCKGEKLEKKQQQKCCFPTQDGPKWEKNYIPRHSMQNPRGKWPKTSTSFGKNRLIGRKSRGYRLHPHNTSNNVFFDFLLSTLFDRGLAVGRGPWDTAVLKKRSKNFHKSFP